MKNVVIVSSSPRIGGNSDTLAHEFEKGAISAGHHVDFVNLAKLKINYCLGCYQCAKNHVCCQKDDFNYFLEIILKADVILFATPTYFYSMCGQLKVFIDRLVANYTAIRADIYLLVSAWDSNKNNLQSTLEAIRGATRDCFEDCPEKGVLLAGGLTDRNDAKSSSYLKTAFEMGKGC